MSDTLYNVLFICTGNSARSLLAEKILEHWGKGKFRAFSAGSLPNGKVNPHTYDTLKKRGLSTAGLQSKSWDEFAHSGSSLIDFVITVCDDAAGEVCPVWQGQPITAHWSIKNPTLVNGTEQDITAAFEQAADLLTSRIKQFVSIPLDDLNEAEIKQQLDQIGQL